MNEEVKNQLDQIGDIVDSKIEKAFNQAQENAKGEVESSLKSEITNLTNEYNEKMEAATKRMDAIEMESKKTLSGVNTKTFKGQIESAIKDGAIDALVKGNTNAARFEIKAADMTMANAYTGVVAGETVIEDFKFDPSRSVHIRTLLPIGNTDAQTIRFPKESAYDDGAAATAQGSAVGQSDFDITATSVNVEKIGTFMRITEEMLNDTPGLSSYLSARVPGKVLSVEDTEILNGDGSSPNLDGLFTDGTAFITSGGAFDDAVGVVSVAWEDGAVLTGGGSVLAALSRDLRTYAETIGGREQMAIEAFASALEIIPRTLAENAGLDPVTTLIALRKAHADGASHAGINVYEGGVVDMKDGNVLEPLRVVEQAIQSATETAIMILRIDDVISSKGVSMADGFGGDGDFHM